MNFDWSVVPEWLKTIGSVLGIFSFIILVVARARKPLSSFWYTEIVGDMEILLIGMLRSGNV